MSSLRRISANVFIVFTAFASVASGSQFTLFKQVWGNVIVITETSEAGQALPQASPQHPVHYKGRSLGCRLGSIGGDREPDVKQLDRFVAGILAKQGYVAVTPNQPDPGMLVVLQWGYVRPTSENLLWFLGYNPADDIAAPAAPIYSLGEIWHPGPEAWLREMRTNLIETILENAKEPIYGIIVTAFDSKTVNDREPLIYWQTRIGLPAKGKTMAEALPVMIKTAGPSIGRPADKPLMLDVDEVRQGNVRLGEPKVIDYQTEPHDDGDRKNGKD